MRDADFWFYGLGTSIELDVKMRDGKQICCFSAQRGRWGVGMLCTGLGLKFWLGSGVLANRLHWDSNFGHYKRRFGELEKA